MNELDKKKLRAGNFVQNNGLVLRTINILRHDYNKLSTVQYVLVDYRVAEDEFLDSINFLSQEGYIKLRLIGSKDEAELAGRSYKDLEAMLSAKGIRLLSGGMSDNMIEV